MSNFEDPRMGTARKNYECAQLELIQRIRLRDHILLIYLSAVGVLLGIALETPQRQQILLAVPLFTLGASILVSQHNYLISLLGHFSANEVGRLLSQIGAGSVQWHNSETLEKYSSKSTGLRTLGHGILLLTPAIVSLSINIKYFRLLLVRIADDLFKEVFKRDPNYVLAVKDASITYEMVWIFGAIFTIFSASVIYTVHKARIEHYKERIWDNDSDSGQTN